MFCAFGNFHSSTKLDHPQVTILEKWSPFFFLLLISTYNLTPSPLDGKYVRFSIVWKTSSLLQTELEKLKRSWLLAYSPCAGWMGKVAQLSEPLQVGTANSKILVSWILVICFFLFFLWKKRIRLGSCLILVGKKDCWGEGNFSTDDRKVNNASLYAGINDDFLN